MLPAVDESVLAALKQTDTVAAATPELAYTISSSDLNQYAWTSLGVIPILLGALWLLAGWMIYCPRLGFARPRISC